MSSAQAEGRSWWLDTLADTVTGVAASWHLTVGHPFEPGGQTAWVAPVRSAQGQELVLKVGWPHHEAMHEAEGLQAWDGDGAIRVVRGHPFRRLQDMCDLWAAAYEQCYWPPTCIRATSCLPLPADHVVQWLFARCVIESPSRPELFDVARRIAPR
ncbi:MAG: hypothetical protein ACR2HR_10010 [Euzebya sp.]